MLCIPVAAIDPLRLDVAPAPGIQCRRAGISEVLRSSWNLYDITNFDYIHAKMLKKRWLRDAIYVASVVTTNTTAAKEYRHALENIPASPALWWSKRRFVINPWRVLQIMLPLLDVLPLSDFIENFKETVNYAEDTIIKRAYEYSSDKYCGAASEWCSEAIEDAAYDVFSDIKKTVKELLWTIKHEYPHYPSFLTITPLP